MPMKFGALYFREHPRLAFVIHAVTVSALGYGRAPWFHDEEAERVTEDFPAGTPLFRSICLRVPPKWKWNSLSIDLGRPCQKATFGDNGSPVFTVDFENWDFAWMGSLIEVSGATTTEVSAFLMDLHRVLRTTDGIERVQWYSGPTAFHAQMTPEELDRGFDLPIDTDDR